MTPKQILDSFSETLIQDERILSPRERMLVTSLLQHAKAATHENPDIQDAVRGVIASAVGETVAQRAFAVLGSSIVERILENGAVPLEEISGEQMKTPGEPQPPSHIKAPPKHHPKPPMKTPGEPQPPSTGPGPGVKAPSKPPMRTPGEPQPPSTGPGPGVKAPHKAPHKAPMRTPGEPQPPSTGPGPSPGPVHLPMKEPQPPSAVRTTTVSASAISIAERPEVLPGRCVVLDEFLAPQELEELTRYTLAHEADFRASEVISPEPAGGIVNYEHRRSVVLMDLAEHQELILERIKSVLPEVLEKLGMDESAIADAEVQITASNDGDFFHFHSDNGSERVASRYLTFVYFFHREPRGFEGGELRIHDARLEDGQYHSQGTYQTIVPQQNQIVFFPCELLHEITPVRCESQQFADSRFTLNGWLRR